MMLVNLCRCTNCEGEYINPSPRPNEPIYPVDNFVYDKLEAVEDYDKEGRYIYVCPICQTDEYINPY